MLFEIEKWVLTHHAKVRQFERKIANEDLERLLKNFDSCIYQGSKYILVRHFNDRNDNKIAAVVVPGDKNVWVILTVMVNFQVVT